MTNLSKILIICTALLLCTSAYCADYSSVSDYGEGRVVWESNRTGSWRIFTSTLDGRESEQQLTPETAGEQSCPSISPDGKYILYMETETGKTAGRMHMLTIADRQDTVLFDEVLNYGGNRFAVFTSPVSFIYINGRRETREYNIDTKKDELLLVNTGDENLLISPHRQYASGYDAGLYRYSSDTRTVEFLKLLNGCQVCFTQDDSIIWNFHTGGPIAVWSSREEDQKDVILQGDGRFPADRGYFYFSNMSWNMDAVCVAASNYDHDHSKADYDIFVCRYDKENRSLIGTPVRYSFDEHTDRFPSVYYASYSLGSAVLEGASKYNITLPVRGKYHYDFGDGTSAEGNESITHLYSRDGTYQLTASNSQHTYKGTVTVTAPQRPYVTAVTAAAAKITVLFNEPVDISKSRFGLKSGAAIKKKTLLNGGRRLELELSKPAAHEDILYVKGITDLAQTPNRMYDNSFKVQSAGWAGDAVISYIPDGNFSIDGQPCTLEGCCFYGREGALSFVSGSVSIDDPKNKIINTLKNDFTAEINFSVRKPEGCICTIYDKEHFLGLCFNNGELYLHSNANAESRTIRTKLKAVTNEEAHHAVVSCGKEINIWLDGERLNISTQADMSMLKEGNIIFGNSIWKTDPFKGDIQGFALYQKAFTEAQAADSRLNYMIKYPRRTVGTINTTIRIDKISHMPTLEEIAPYRDALIMCDVTLKDNTRAKMTVRAIINGSTAFGFEEGKEYTAVLEKYEDNPQLENIYTSDTLDFEDLPVYYCRQEE